MQVLCQKSRVQGLQSRTLRSHMATCRWSGASHFHITCCPSWVKQGTFSRCPLRPSDCSRELQGPCMPSQGDQSPSHMQSSRLDVFAQSLRSYSSDCWHAEGMSNNCQNLMICLAWLLLTLTLPSLWTRVGLRVYMCLQVTAVTFGLGAFSGGLPVFAEDGSVISFLQGSVLIASTILSLALTRKLSSRPWLRILPQCFLTAIFAAEAWLLILAPQ